MALHLVELGAAFEHELSIVGHLIGPVVNLVLGTFEHIGDKQKEADDAFLGTSQLLSQLVDIDRHLRKIAVGVYRTPDFWPRLGEVQAQRKKRGLSEAYQMSASSPLTEEEGQTGVLAALSQFQQRKLIAGR